MAIPEPKDQWYVLHVLSMQENNVKARIERKVREAELSDFVYRVEIPTELVSEVREGKKTERRVKLFPGYVYVNMYLREADGKLNKDMWYFIQMIDGVISIAGVSKSSDGPMPQPMRPREVADLLRLIDSQDVTSRPKVDYAVGDAVRVSDGGPFDGQEGIIEEIDSEKGKLRVSITMFERATPVDLEYWQVKKD